MKPRHLRYCTGQPRRTATPFVTALFILLLSILPGSAALAQSQDPVALVEGTANRIVNAINAREAEFRADPAALEAMVRSDLLPLLDIEYSARLILGRAGRSASPAQLAAFSEAMSNLLIQRYARGLLAYRDRNQVEVLPQRGALDPRMTRVRTRVRLANGAEVPVDYVFRQTEGEWKAFDVIVEGISYVTTYRNQVMPQVEAEGIDAVTARLVKGELKLQDQ